MATNPFVTLDRHDAGLEGNVLHRAVVQPCEFRVTYHAEVEIEPDVQRPSQLGEASPSEIPADVLPYLNPSRYCESDLLARFAFEEFGQMVRGFSRVQAICDWVGNHLDYVAGSTNSSTTSADVLLQRTGVCRDYAHLAITLCRGVGIPARYVAGYAAGLQPPDFHGFLEAFLDGQWYLFDPTRLAAVSNLVRIGVGRDAADVSFATLTGDSQLLQKTVSAVETNPAGRIVGDGPAVSTA